MSECPLCERHEGLPPHLADRGLSRVEMRLGRAVALDTRKVFCLLTLTEMDSGDECEWNVRYCPLCGRDLRREGE